MERDGFRFIRETWEERDLPAGVLAFLHDAQARGEAEDVFEFVPADYDMIHRVLDDLPKGRFLEWGCGTGAITGMAEMLGWEATGIEIDPGLAESGRKLFREFGLKSEILTGEVMEFPVEADVVYMYMWPGQVMKFLAYFLEQATPETKLLLYEGGELLRLYEPLP